jgi:hypothetical protein
VTASVAPIERLPGLPDTLGWAGEGSRVLDLRDGMEETVAQRATRERRLLREFGDAHLQLAPLLLDPDGEEEDGASGAAGQRVIAREETPSLGR